MEIKASELRLGNYVQGVTSKLKYKIDIDNLKDVDAFDGIPLTSEILEKCGFKDKSQTTDLCFELPNLILAGQRKKLFPCIWGEGGPEAYGIEIEYLHQLQNLYFALTGEELNIKL